MDANSKQAYWRDALLAFSRMSGWVVGPVIVALFFGKWLDKKFDTAPYLFIGVTGLAFIVSMYGLFREGVNYKRDTEAKLNSEKNDGDQSHNN
jgi:F0F1-type ATP synthase assembly protein I